MKIPKKLKIGGIVYDVQKTKDLKNGSNYYSGEVDYMECVIRIHPANTQKMEADFCHEMVHGIFDYLGYTNHNEKKVDELAKALYMVFKDNPKMFES